MHIMERGRSASLQEGNSGVGVNGVNGVVGPVGEKEDRRQNHSATERRYRQDLNSQINELKMVVPACSSPRVKAAALNKVGVLKRTTEYIAFMQHQEHIQRLAQKQHSLNIKPIGAALPQQLAQLKEQQQLVEEQQAVIEYLKREIIAYKNQNPDIEVLFPHPPPSPTPSSSYSLSPSLSSPLSSF